MTRPPPSVKFYFFFPKTASIRLSIPDFLYGISPERRASLRALCQFLLTFFVPTPVSLAASFLP